MVSTGWSCHIPLKRHGVTGENGKQKINGRKPQASCAVTLDTGQAYAWHFTFSLLLSPSRFLLFAKIVTV